MSTEKALSLIVALTVAMLAWWATEVWSQQKEHDKRLQAVERSIIGIEKSVTSQAATMEKVAETQNTAIKILDRLSAEPTPGR